MLISEFSRATGLSVDTIRFYIRRGLIQPKLGLKGGRNPYQTFKPEHVQAAKVIRLSQSLGFSLKEIADLANEYSSGNMTPARSRAIMLSQLHRLEQKASEIEILISFVRQKIAWVESGQTGQEPELVDR
jgi:MerR family transcriptional regulator, copper efflux regulator